MHSAISPVSCCVPWNRDVLNSEWPEYHRNHVQFQHQLPRFITLVSSVHHQRNFHRPGTEFQQEYERIADRMEVARIASEIVQTVVVE
jgi:hypothetical protein